VLGVQPIVGSTFPTVFDRTRNFGLVISHGLWTRKFGQDPNIVGRSMTLDGAPGCVWRLGQVDPGFDTDRALTFRVELGWAAYTTLEQTTAFNRKMLERLRSLPGVLTVTFDNNLPLSGKPRQPIAIRASGRPIDDTQTPYVHLHLVGLPLAFVLARTVEHVLFEVPPADPATFVATPVALLIVGGLACYLPARRAARLGPLVALRGG
jgi:hypothetical protein